MSLISGTFNGVGQDSVEMTFDASDYQGDIACLSLQGTFSGTVQLQRSLDGGATFVVCSLDSTGTAAEWSSPISVDIEVRATSMPFRLTTTAWTSGTVTYQLLWQPPMRKVRTVG